MSRSGLAAALAIVAVAAWWFWPGGEERRVRARLEEAAAAVSARAGEAEIARVTRVAALARTLAPDVVLVAPDGASIRGRDAIVGLAGRIAAASPFRVELADVEVVLDDDEREATVHATALVEEGTDPRGVNGQEFRFELRREDGAWLIVRAEAIAALEKPE